MTVDQTTTLHYIDKVHSTLIETGKAVNRQFLLLILLSILLLAMSSGLVIADQKISLSGLNVQFQSWFLSFVCAWLLLFSYVRFLGLANHEHRLRDTIFRLYESVGFHDESMDDLSSNPLEYPSIMTVALSEKNIDLGSAQFPIEVIVFIGTFLLPIGTLVFAGYSLMEDQGPLWWLIGSFLIIGFVAISYTIAFFRDLK